MPSTRRTRKDFAENFFEAAAGIRDGFYVSHGRLLLRVEQEAWIKEIKEAWKDHVRLMERKEWHVNTKDGGLHEQRFCNFRGATSL